MIFQDKLIETAIFDMDGTMFDTERLRMKMLKEASKQLCGFELSDEFLYAAFGLSAGSSEALAKEYYGENFPYKDVRKKSDELELSYIRKNGVPIKKGLFGVLERLKKSEVLLALATSSKREIAKEYLALAGVLHFFNILVCGDEVEKGKPDPEIFESALFELNAKKERCLIIEDSQNGLIAASASGALPVFIKDIKDVSDEVKSGIYKSYKSMLQFEDDLIMFTPKLPIPSLNEHVPQSCENIKAGIHGFGAIGGGYLAQIFSHWDGYVRPAQIIGATRNDMVRLMINAYGKYSVMYESKAYLQTLRNVSVIDIDNEQQVIDMYNDCVIVGLSLPESVIKLQANTIAKGLIHRYSNGKDSITILIVLNKVNGGKFVREHVFKAMTKLVDTETAKTYVKKTYFCETVVNRMVSKISAERVITKLTNDLTNIERSTSTLRQYVSSLYTLPSIKKMKKNGERDKMLENIATKLNGIAGFLNLVNELPLVLFSSEPDMILYADDKSPLVRRLRQVKVVSDIKVLQNVKNKLSNGTHAILAWYASLLGYTTIGQGIGSPRVLSLVKSIMGEEIKPSLIAMNPEYEEYIDLFTISFIKRCRASFKDNCIRVGRDPLRKLQPDERVLGSIKMAIAANVRYEKLLFGAACAIMYSVKQINPKDEEAEFVRQLFLKNNSVADVLTYTGEFKGIKCKGLDPQRDAEIIDGIERAYEKLKHEIT